MKRNDTCAVCGKIWYSSNLRYCQYGELSGKIVCRYCCMKCGANAIEGTGQVCKGAKQECGD